MFKDKFFIIKQNLLKNITFKNKTAETRFIYYFFILKNTKY